ncbi:lipopolysaccharide biosynthesis protein [Thalassospira tepidiphila]|uniref:lipopolysaccharide biosynthesis protein n=1 Tax=Thalassospira tepidiphila TaxID=393657 RepID=UPI0030C76F50
MRFLAEAASRGSGFVVAPLLAWSLGASVFGSYTQVLALTFALVPIVSAGMGYTVIRQLAGSQDDYSSRTTLSAAVGIISLVCAGLGVLLVAFSSEVTSYLSLDVAVSAASLMVAVALLSWLVALEALIQEYLRAMQMVRQSLYVQLASIGIHLAALLVAAYLGSLSIWLALILLGASKLMVISILLSVTVFKIKNRGSNYFSIPATRTLLAGIPFMLAGLAEWASNLGDRLVVGKYLGPEIVAQYVAAAMLLSSIAALGAPLWWLLFPEMVKYTKLSDWKRCKEKVQYRTTVFIELSFPTLCLLSLLADPLISLLVNTRSTGMSAVVFMLGIAVLLNQVSTGWEYFVIAMSSGKQLVAVTVCCLATGFLIALLAAPVWGIFGVALGILFGKLLLAGSLAYLANRVGFSGVVWKVNPAAVILGANLMIFILVSIIAHFVSPANAISKIVLGGGMFLFLQAIAYAGYFRLGGITQLRSV